LSNDISRSKMVPHSNFSLCTFNCRSIKSYVSEVRELCGKFHLVCVQKHWLLPNELDYLSSINSDFLAVGRSAVDISRSTLVGRPHGGTGILYKSLLLQ